jgi:hypothetical protein
MLLYYYTRPGIVILYSGRPLAELTDRERWLARQDATSSLASTLFMLYLFPLLIVGAALVFFLFLVTSAAPTR